MVVIPRYSGSLGSSPIRSGRSISTGTEGASGLMQLGKTISAGLNAYSEQKIALTAKLRDQDILNKSLMADSEAKTLNSNFVDNYLPQINDYQQYNTEYDKYWKSREKTIKEKFFTVNGQLDEFAWQKYQPNYWAEYVTGKTAVNKEVAKARNNQTLTVFENWNATFLQTTNNASTEAELISSYQDLKDVWSAYENNSTFDQSVLSTRKKTLIDAINNRYMMIQASKASPNGKIPTYRNPDGKEVIDYGLIASYLSDESTPMQDIDGNELDITNPIRVDLINKLQNDANAQINFDERRAIVLGKEESVAFLNNFTPAMKDGITVEEYNTLSKQLIDSQNMRPEDKNSYQATLDRLYASKKGDLSAATKTDADQNYRKWQILISTGIIDTEQEINVIRNLGLEGYFGDNDTTQLIKQASDLLDEKNSWKKESFKKGAQTLGQAIGVTYKFDQNLNLTSFDSVAEFISSSVDNAQRFNVSPLQASMLSELRRLIKIGEDKGISHYDMLENIESPNYLITPLIKEYNEEIGLAIKGEFEKMVAETYDRGDAIIITNNRYLIDKGFFDRNYGGPPDRNISASAFVNETDGVDIPLYKKENQTIAEYMDELQKFLETNPQTSKTEIPSILQSGAATFADGIIIDSE